MILLQCETKALFIQHIALADVKDSLWETIRPWNLLA